MSKSKAPTIRIEDIEASVKAWYFVNGTNMVFTMSKTMIDEPALDTLTLCIAVMNNDFIVVGKSVCLEPEGFDQEKGKRLAKEDAMDQMRALLAFQYKDDMQRELEQQAVQSSEIEIPLASLPNILGLLKGLSIRG